ncbi:MAG TPA: hypothetical protein VJI98_06395 [Candidatus Nanoarchaeia archaeon]|nr:hypothetical protein [Candidatus Nanoarchaeia archaeon]
MVKKSLTPQAFYKVLFSVMTLFILVMLILILPEMGNLSGYTTAIESAPILDKGVEFIPCPDTFSSETCYYGSKTKIWFAPVFRVFKVKPHTFLRSTLSWGFQPTCWYQGDNGQLYRLQGKITVGGPCAAVENGFRCEK